MRALPEVVETRDTAADDLELVQRALDGSSDAFAALVEKHQDRVFAVASRLVPTREDALDISQEVFIKVYRGLAGFKTDARFTTWLHRIVLNTCTSFHRMRGAAKRGTAVSLHVNSDRDGGELEVPGNIRSPQQSAHAAELRIQVTAAIADLEEDYQQVIVMRDIDGLGYDEISDALGIPAGTVRSRLHRGRKELSRKLAHLADSVGGEDFDGVS